MPITTKYLLWQILQELKRITHLLTEYKTKKEIEPNKELIETLTDAYKKLECPKCEVKNKWMESEAVKVLKQEIKKLKEEKKKLKKQISELKKREKKVIAINRRLLSQIKNSYFLKNEQQLKDLIYLAEKYGITTEILALAEKDGEFYRIRVSFIGVNEEVNSGVNKKVKAEG